jgi:hypothetical protein
MDHEPKEFLFTIEGHFWAKYFTCALDHDQIIENLGLLFGDTEYIYELYYYLGDGIDFVYRVRHPHKYECYTLSAKVRNNWYEVGNADGQAVLGKKGSLGILGKDKYFKTC